MPLLPVHRINYRLILTGPGNGATTPEHEMNKPKWQKPLNKTEIKHLRDMGVTTLAQAKRNAEFQAGLRERNRDEPMGEPCWDCRRINQKIGLPI